FATRKGWAAASFGPIFLYYIVNILPQWPSGLQQSAPFVFMVLLGGALFGLYGALAMMFVSVGTMIAYIALVPSVFPAFPLYDPTSLGVQSFDLLIALAFVYVFLRLARAREQQGELEAAQQRLQLAGITTRLSGRLDRSSLSSLLSGAVDLIRDSYPDMYHVQIFLIDPERRVAQLTASTGEVGQLLLARAHALGVGSQSVIGQVSATDQPVIARAGDRSGVHRRNELLPETAAEAAFPLRVGDEVIGVLDLQSRREDAFPPDELAIFQSLADSVAVVIDNVRLNDETRARLAENEQLLLESQSAMREVDTLNRQLTGRGWQEFIFGRSETAFTYEGAGQRIASGADWTPTLAEAVEFDRVVQAESKDGTVITVPLRVRGQVIGAMEFELDKGRLAQADLDLLQQVSERLGISLDSLRSFEQARELAAQQERVSDISARYQQVTTVDDLLRITLDELSGTLGAERGTIRIGGMTPANAPVTNGALS
ncbi:MAG TPA: GAF domain-containing protein, partial [Candidatus Limnocylindrales bacterium]|nr:GAF domain-containing protein [Candidatus Limnocylindrales bacterium]